MKNKEIKQTIFLGFLLATILELYAFVKSGWVTLSNRFLGQMGGDYAAITFLIFMISLCLFITGIFPDLINLKDKRLGEYFQQMGILAFILVALMLFRIMFLIGSRIN